jgi:hypothetical protein
MRDDIKDCGIRGNAVTNGRPCLQGIQDVRGVSYRPGSYPPGRGLRWPAARTSKNGRAFAQGHRSGKAFACSNGSNAVRGRNSHQRGPHRHQPAADRSSVSQSRARAEFALAPVVLLPAPPSTGLARSSLALACEVPTCEQGRSGRAIADLRESTWVTPFTTARAEGQSWMGKAERGGDKKREPCAQESRKVSGDVQDESPARYTPRYMYVCRGPAECR